MNKKRGLRLDPQGALALRRESPRRRANAGARPRQGRPPVEGADPAWATDFVSVTLADGRTARVLTVLGAFTREGLAVRADARFTADRVVRVPEDLKTRRGVPRSVRVENGPGFAGRVLDPWAYGNTATLDFSRPGGPTDDACIERFSGRRRAECLDPHGFRCLDGLRTRTESWRVAYNRGRPHNPSGNLTPEEFAAREAGKIRPDPRPKLA